MSPFQKNFQRLLIFFFTSGSIILVIMGISRSKGASLSVTPAEGQKNAPIAQNAHGTVQGSSVFTGKIYQTPWGNAVASISVVNGKIVGVTMPEVPQSPPSQYAEPYLIQQALEVGSANIQGVSGATYTSIAFKSSLESAIAQAGANGQTVVPNTDISSISASRPAVPRSYTDDDYYDDDY